MKSKIVTAIVAALIALSAAGTAFADPPNPGPPHPPTCVPASTPGCSR